ncbi:hypothetical protein [Flavobacterium sp. NRK F7]|uniref:hypothetical protein n=1 Tax=Flavobacterium sp. NRK F7 TaxID=2954930 RepID=UPI0020911545|nr:hypothetical protein [Flavobacterium sp. NRK F7]MCO6162997.1 hypothetical protein [Flavobacterium sp. NRK F7]
MEEKFCWRCNTKVKMLSDAEFSLCQAALFGGKKVVEEELIKRNSTNYIWLEHLETFERFRYFVEMYRLLTGVYEPNPNAIFHHVSSQYGMDCPKCTKPFRTPQAKYCASCGYGNEQLTKI